MTIPLLLRLISLVAVILSGVLYFQIRGQKLGLEENLAQSHAALLAKTAEASELKSQVVNAEEKIRAMSQRAEEEKSLTGHYRKRLDNLTAQVNQLEETETNVRQEAEKLASTNRDLQRQLNALQAPIPPQNWREQLSRLPSRLLALQAENASMRKPQGPPTGGASATTPATTIQSRNPQALPKPVGEVVRMGPDGSFVILNYGRQLGAAEGQTLTIRREEHGVVLVQVTQITNDFSIAQILSSNNTGQNSKVSDIRIGDFAHLK